MEDITSMHRLGKQEGCIDAQQGEDGFCFSVSLWSSESLFCTLLLSPSLFLCNTQKHEHPPSLLCVFVNYASNTASPLLGRAPDCKVKLILQLISV